MNQLLANKDLYRGAKMDKATFISTMYAEHSRLFAYCEYLTQVNIGEIRISPQGILAEFKDPRVVMFCPSGDKRTAPIEALNFGDYEHDEIQSVRQIVSRLGGAAVNFFDIGANVGFYSLALSHYFPGIHGLAFEPVPTTFGHLQANLKLNSVSAVQALNLGLSDKAGEMTFFTYPSQSGASSMTHNVESPDVLEVKCRVMRLDDYCASSGASAGFIKCDVEGAELFVFRGAAETIAKDCPVVFTEMLRKWCAKYNYHPNDIISFFHQLGYECYVVQGPRLRACPTVTADTIETNFLFLHRVRHSGLISEMAG